MGNLLIYRELDKPFDTGCFYLVTPKFCLFGASVVRESTLKRARAEVRKNQVAGDGFDWIHVGGHLVDAGKTLFGEI